MISLYKPVKWSHCLWWHSGLSAEPTLSLQVAAPSCVSLQESRFPFYPSWKWFGKSHRTIRTGLLVQDVECLCTCAHGHVHDQASCRKRLCDPLHGKEGGVWIAHCILPHPSQRNSLLPVRFKNWCHFIVCFMNRAKMLWWDQFSHQKQCLGGLSTRETTGG